MRIKKSLHYQLELVFLGKKNPNKQGPSAEGDTPTSNLDFLKN
jgi:hypothetical protein